MSSSSHVAFLDREYFENLVNYLMQLRAPREHILVSLSAESSQYIRINGAKVRQNGIVEDASLEITLIYESSAGSLHQCTHDFTLCGLSYEDKNQIRGILEAMRAEVKQLPDDPYVELPLAEQISSSEKHGTLLSEADAVSELLNPMDQLDLAGIYASGPVVRAMASSSGHSHWFYTENYSLDYSLYTPSQRALKNTFAGTDWNSGEFKNQIQFAREQLKILEKSPKQIPRGPYRCYLAPAAVSEIVQMLSWGCMSEASIRQGDSPLMKVRSGERSFSSLFSLNEDFRVCETPRFNSEGELSPEFLPLIEKGGLSHTLISSRTAKEYEIKSNFACESETLRAPSVAAGSLHESEVLQKLGTGLYLSNLHYLNWSDQSGGRITGMTRYACFWVENGVITAPIENLRFDDSIFNIFGSALEMLTQSRSYLPEVGTYEGRSTGGMNLPGLLLSEMNFTL